MAGLSVERFVSYVHGLSHKIDPDPSTKIDPETSKVLNLLDFHEPPRLDVVRRKVAEALRGLGLD